jgi:hypothetical protein
MAATLDIQQRIDSYAQKHAEIAKLMKFLRSPMHKCHPNAQYKVLEADRQGVLECTLIGRRTRILGYRVSGFVGSWRSPFTSK